ncbi:MAG: endonuclease/exonuclease/phosphatase family protein [Acidobacteria bacterium]|nr:endonuclease/exonuclease/phosphatase family protein [Acidobacteriota bacterium]
MRPFLLLACTAIACVGLGAETLRVMSFNVRYPSPGDGEDVWAKRRDLLVETVRTQAPDVMGTQELFFEQGQYIVEKLPEYAWFGLSRRGNHEDEHMGVFYRKDRLQLVDNGDFWLSPTPEKAGSMAWNMSLPRMCTWGLFEIKGTGTKFLYLNTHLAHRGNDEPARQMSAKLLAFRIGMQDEKLPVVLTGDFNAPAGGPTYALLSPPLKDARAEAAQKEGPEGTFHGFKGKVGAARIDWILYRAPWTVERQEAITFNKDGRYPSDHLPVIAVFKLP